jgi:sec-independent protein translocase protein TatC
MAQAVAEQSLHQHLQELRRRGLWTFSVIAGGAGLGYYFRVRLIALLQRPLHQHLYYTSPTGSFEFTMKLCLLVGFVLALPVLLYHVLRYIEPAFQRRFSRPLICLVISLSLLLALGGIVFAYYVSLPAALRFFNSVNSSQITPLISVDEYFRFVFAYLVSFAVVFQLPLILLFIDHVTPLGPGSLGRCRKFVVVGAFAIAIITPSAPDPLSQIILALPIILLYEVTLLIIRVRHWRRRPKARLEPAPVAAPPIISEAAPLQSFQPESSAPQPALAQSNVLDLSWAVKPEPRRDNLSHVLDLRKASEG